MDFIVVEDCNNFLFRFIQYLTVHLPNELIEYLEYSDWNVIQLHQRLVQLLLQRYEAQNSVVKSYKYFSICECNVQVTALRSFIISEMFLVVYSPAASRARVK
jgi:hypothetical protein